MRELGVRMLDTIAEYVKKYMDAFDIDIRKDDPMLTFLNIILALMVSGLALGIVLGLVVLIVKNSCFRIGVLLVGGSMYGIYRLFKWAEDKS